MKNLERFQKDTIVDIRKDIDAALNEIGKKWGISLDTGNLSYSDKNFTTKISGAVVSKSGIVMSKQATDFNRIGKRYLPGVNVGDKVSHLGMEYTITGWNTRSRKNPVEMEMDGKSYKVSVELIRQLLS
mgnify:CR=1 FL=1